VKKLYMVFALVSVLNVGALKAIIRAEVMQSNGDIIISHQGGSLNLAGLTSTAITDEPWILGLFTIFGSAPSALFGGQPLNNRALRWNGPLLAVDSSGWGATSFISGDTGSGGLGGFSGISGQLNNPNLFLPDSYTGGQLAPASATWANTQLSSIGLTVGDTLTAVWGANESYMVVVVPEPCSGTALLGCLLLVVLIATRIRRPKGP